MQSSACLDPADFTLFNGGSSDWPVLVTVPHAGRDYPAPMAELVKVSIAELVALEDRHVDFLAEGCVAAGIPVLVARRPRAWIDLNRAENEVDADMIAGLEWQELPTASRKVRAGLGLIPKRLGRVDNFWNGKIAREALNIRIERHYRPFHAAISAILERMLKRHGYALVLDLHSMPPLALRGGRPSPEIVIGDLHGRSAGAAHSLAALDVAKRHGLIAHRNQPYAGGHLLQRHFDRGRNIHALQVEIDRGLYLDRTLREPGPGVEALTAFVTEVALELAEAGRMVPDQIAAE